MDCNSQSIFSNAAHVSLISSALGFDVVNLHIIVVDLAATIGAMSVVLRIDRLADKTITNFLRH